MKLVFIRHGDPDYEHDSLTPQGRIEAACLAERISALDVKNFYVSPLGRARETAEYTLKKVNREAETFDWLREFGPRILRPDRKERAGVSWDWLPQDWLQFPEFLDRNQWMNHPVFQEAGVGKEYERVTRSLDELLAAHGYERCGFYYRTAAANQDRLVFFCHFGVTCVLLSHLMNVSPMPLWHGLAMAPTSVTVVNTEERREGIVSFRASMVGDISHLYQAGIEPSFSARFCECWKNEEERHD